MPANYVLLEKITVGAAGASSVTFSGIPQTGYTDLVVKMSTRRTQAYADIYIRFNNDSGANYSMRQVRGDGSATSSSSSSAQTIGYAGNGADRSSYTANTFGNVEIYIPNAFGSTAKSYSIDSVNENNATQADAMLVAGLWSGTAAISSITLFPDVGYGDFVQYSTFYLYGVAKLGTTPAIVPYATGGDTIMTDGTYWYHTFTSSGTFTPAKALSCDYLVVAGGGGGGWAYISGGGGAGGLRSTVGATGGGGSLESKLNLLSGTGYTVTIGAGGAGATSVSASRRGLSGSNSTFSTITSTGGGGGGGNAGDNSGATGGSGGGSGNNGSSAGSGTTNQGYAGGTFAYVNTPPEKGGGGGGGGAGALGGNASTVTNAGGNGGAGVTTNISGTSVTYAGGGGGSGIASTAGTGGSGGGGNGGNLSTTDAVSGTANTGGGGGGAGGTGTGPGPAGAGGSGIVIVRYAV